MKRAPSMSRAMPDLRYVRTDSSISTASSRSLRGGKSRPKRTARTPATSPTPFSSLMRRPRRSASRRRNTTTDGGSRRMTSKRRYRPDASRNRWPPSCVCFEKKVLSSPIRHPPKVYNQPEDLGQVLSPLVFSSQDKDRRGGSQILFLNDTPRR